MNASTMLPRVPERSTDQRLLSLAKANLHRSLRAQLKVDVKAGEKRAPLVILDPPEWAETMKVWDLLMAVPRFGRAKVGRMFRMHHISPSKTLAGLSGRQRDELAQALLDEGA